MEILNKLDTENVDYYKIFLINDDYSSKNKRVRENEVIRAFYKLSHKMTQPAVLNNREKLARYDRYQNVLYDANEPFEFEIGVASM